MSASFDCKHWKTDIEAEICSYSTVSELDGRMGTLYRRAILIAKDREALRKTQIEWLKSQRDLCLEDERFKVEPCLRSAYEKRNQYLFKVIEESESVDISKYVGHYRRPTTMTCMKSGESNELKESVCEVDDQLAITREDDGAISIQVNTVGARDHVCGTEGHVSRKGNTLVHQFEEKPAPPCVLVLYLDPDGVLIEDRNDRNCFCGANAIIDGYKFFVNEKINVSNRREAGR